MPWNIYLHTDQPIIETRYWGLIGQTELSDAVTKTGDLITEHNRTLILSDCTGLEAGGHSIVDLYFIADELAKSGLADIIKEAILLPTEIASTDMVRFWETACYNRGLKVRIFDQRESALAWLLT